MCGIFFSNLNNIDLEYITRDLRKRGPDFLNVLKFSTVSHESTLVHALLSVETINTNVSQPFKLSDGSFFSFNGEIYNYRLLNEKFNFKADSDTEVLAGLIERFGLAKAINYITGPIAVILFDPLHDTVLFYRDPLGEKPLFYKLSHGKISISSTESALIHGSSNDVSTKLRKQFITAGFTETGCMFLGLNSCDPGILYQFSNHEVKRVAKFLPKLNSSGLNVDDIDTSTRRSIDLVLPKKIKPVLFFSGGADSSYIRQLATDQAFEKILMLGNIKPQFSSDKLILVKPNFSASHILRYIRILGSPLGDPAGLGFFTLALVARQHSKVVITGDGVDEILETYPKNRKLSLLPLDLQSILLDLFFLRKLRAKNSLTLSKNLEYHTRFDAGLRLPNYLLMRADLPTMGAGVEARSPFLIWENFARFRRYSKVDKDKIKSRMVASEHYQKVGFPSDLKAINIALRSICHKLDIPFTSKRNDLHTYRSNLLNIWIRVHGR